MKCTRWFATTLRSRRPGDSGARRDAASKDRLGKGSIVKPVRPIGHARGRPDTLLTPFPYPARFFLEVAYQFENTSLPKLPGSGEPA
jgi:hypothetical protein